MSTNDQKQQQLKELHEKRKQETDNRIFEAIERLKENGSKINYNTVAEESGVSKRTLYNKPEVVKIIDQLRIQKQNKKKSVSDDSKDRIIEMLKRKIELLEQDNKELKSQLEGKYVDLYEQL